MKFKVFILYYNILIMSKFLEYSLMCIFSTVSNYFSVLKTKRGILFSSYYYIANICKREDILLLLSNTNYQICSNLINILCIVAKLVIVMSYILLSMIINILFRSFVNYSFELLLFVIT